MRSRRCQTTLDDIASELEDQFQPELDSDDELLWNKHLCHVLLLIEPVGTTLGRFFCNLYIVSPQDNLIKHYFWLTMGHNSDFESVGVWTWTSWMIWMPVLTFSLAFLSWFADFKLFVSSGHFLIIMLGNWHGSTISGKGPLLLCNYPLWVCKAFFVFDRYFNIFLGYVKAHFVSMDIMLVHCIFCP